VSAPRLRTLLVAVTTAVTVLAIAVTAALVALSGALDSHVAALASTVENLRIAADAQVALRDHRRAGSDAERAVAATQLISALDRAAVRADDERTAAALGSARADAEAYLAASAAHLPPVEVAELRQATYEGLEELVATNLDVARQARVAGRDLDTLAFGLGAGAAALLIGGVGVFLWWLRSRAFQPLLALGAAMERYGRGDASSRAAETGAAELHEMASRFNTMADSLDESHRARLAFLGGVAHDLRNPLNALSLSLDLVPPERPLPRETDLRRILERARRQVARLDRMIADLLDMTRIETGQLDMRFDDVDLARLVAGVVDGFQGATPKHRLVAVLSEEPLPVRCDPGRIEQVIGNLISNAIKYSPDGGTIEVSAARRGDDLEIAVQDSGMGIGADDLQHVFEPFRRGAETALLAPGAGLGLFVVRRIVDAHAGSIEVDSEPGVGSTFRVRIPIVPVQGATALPPGSDGKGRDVGAEGSAGAPPI